MAMPDPSKTQTCYRLKVGFIHEVRSTGMGSLPPLTSCAVTSMSCVNAQCLIAERSRPQAVFHATGAGTLPVRSGVRKGNRLASVNKCSAAGRPLP